MFSAPSSSTYSPPLPASRTASQRHAALRFSPTTTAGTNTNRAAQPQPELQGSFVAEQLSRGARQRAAAALRARLTHHLDAALAQPSTCAANPQSHLTQLRRSRFDLKDSQPPFSQLSDTQISNGSMAFVLCAAFLVGRLGHRCSRHTQRRCRCPTPRSPRSAPAPYNAAALTQRYARPHTLCCPLLPSSSEQHSSEHCLEALQESVTVSPCPSVRLSLRG